MMNTKQGSMSMNVPDGTTKDKPQLLMLTHRVPFPPDRGDRIRSWNILQHLAQRADISLACVTSEPIHPKARESLASVCRRVAVAPVGIRSRWLRAGASFASGKSMTEGLFWSPRLAKTLDHWADSLPFDAALVYCSSMMPYVRSKHLRDIPRVVDLVDVDSQKWQDYAAKARNFKRILFRTEARRVQFLEREIVSTSDAITLASDAEASLFRNVHDQQLTSVHGISNGVDVDYYNPSIILEKSDPNSEIHSDDKPFQLAFVGVLDYFPNIDGLQWFVNEVWHQLKKAVPHARLEIIGRNPGPSIHKLSRWDGIEVIGSVDDVRPYLNRADAVIAPLRIARGIQNKVLEAMSMGKPVVATRQAAEGIEAIAEEHLLVADSAIDWIECLTDLNRKHEMRERVGDAARKFILQQYTWPARLRRLDGLLGLGVE